MIRFDEKNRPVLPGPKFCPYCCGDKTARHLRFIGNLWSPVLRIAMRCDVCEKEYESRVVVRLEEIDTSRAMRVFSPRCRKMKDYRAAVSKKKSEVQPTLF